jgi:DNA primase
MKSKDLDRSGLVTPADYLSRGGYKFKASTHARFASVCCPFHDDKRPSMVMSLDTGSYRCMACGERGRDLIEFHRQRTGLGFLAAFRDLGGRVIKRRAS